ncbi:TonB-dependent receptor, partial [bacterium]|nr:TonB-dependent receptor [bacterium]
MFKIIKIALLLTLFLGSFQVAHAQTGRFDITGSVVDSTKIGIPSATVVALTRADSVLTKFATSDNNGAFRLRRLAAGEYILQISYVGYQTIRQNIEVKEADLDVGQLIMHELVSELDELVVSAEHIPFRVTKDTLSFNAAAFATRPNAVVEDLLRRLPGVEVGEDGSITVQGETVQKVLVDGKEFFGSDPTIATKNLPADAVERVEVYDKQSDKA